MAEVIIRITDKGDGAVSLHFESTPSVSEGLQSPAQGLAAVALEAITAASTPKPAKKARRARG